MLTLCMVRLALVLLVSCLSSQAQVLLPIPQAPSTPTLPLPINTGGYFVFSWPHDAMGNQQSIVTTNPPVEVRSGVVKIGTWSYGTWFLKSNGEVVLYYNQGGAGVAPTKVNLPSFFKTNISKFYSTPPELMVGVSSSGQMGLMFGTNIGSFSQPTGSTNVVEVIMQPGGGPGGFLSLHSDGKIKHWWVSGTNISATNHVAEQLENVKALDGSADCGLAISDNGQVYGWNSSTQLLPIPYAASSGVVQVSAPLTAAGNPTFYALKNDGSIVYWDLQGSQFLLPTSFTGKQFVQVFGIEDGASNLSFALTRTGELIGWRRLWDGTLETLSLPPSLSSGINQIKWTIDNMSRRRLVALNNQGGILPVSDLGAPGWGVDGSVPYGIATRGGILNSIVLGSGGGATGPSNYSLSSDGDLAVETYSGLPLDLLAKLVADRILSVSNNLGIATKSEVGGAISQGVQQVLSAPSDYNLFTTQQIQTERTAGQNDVLSNPNQWTLYTTNQIKAMVMGDLMLTRTNNGQFVLNYDIEQSDDLVAWSPYQNFAMPLTNLPTNKAFVRIKLKNQQ